jgi:osmoprotectant transport system ATP-binding protein
MELIRFEKIQKSYANEIKIIDNLNFTINQGEFITLIGKSGCGKTTMLKLINGLIKPDTGKIFIKGKEINDWDIIELRRSIGYVIQQIGLFPHMSIEDNIAYVLNIKKESKEVTKNRAKELIELVGLNEDYLKKYPRELSGGQKQRIGVARALASNPDIILMDEPFGAVDEITRRTLQEEIIKLQETLKKTIVFVTHDIEEAFKLGSRIVLLDSGKIVQEGTREEMLFNPKNQFVKDFFGNKDFTAYLNVTNIKTAITPISKEKKVYYEKMYKVKNIHSVKDDSTLMDGIKALFDYRVDSIGVEDEKGELIGEFAMKNSSSAV